MWQRWICLRFASVNTWQNRQFCIFVYFASLASILIQPKRSKIALPWPALSPRTPALHRSIGSRGNVALDPAGSWPDQATGSLKKSETSVFWFQWILNIFKCMLLLISRKIQRTSYYGHRKPDYIQCHDLLTLLYMYEIGNLDMNIIMISYSFCCFLRPMSLSSLQVRLKR